MESREDQQNKTPMIINQTPNDVLTKLLFNLLPEDLGHYARLVNKQFNAIIDENISSQLWEAKYALHFPQGYASTLKFLFWKDINWKTHFFESYNSELQYFENSVFSRLLTDINRKELSRNVLKLFSCAREGHYQAFTKTLSDVLTIYPQATVTLLTRIHNQEGESILGCVKRNIDAEGIMFNAIYQKLVIPTFLNQPRKKILDEGQLDWAIICRQPKAIIDELIEYKNFVVDITVLNTALREGHDEAVETLLLLKPEIIEEQIENKSILQLAILYGHKKIIEYLIINKKMDVNAVNAFGETPLHSAALGGCLTIFKFLIDQGASIDAVSNKGWNMLHFAASKGQNEIIHFLITKKFNLDEVNTEGETPLHLALTGDYLSTMQLLANHGASLKIPSKDGWHLIHTAANKSEEIVRYLISKNANVNVSLSDGEQPLHLAARQDCNKIISILLENEAQIDAKSSNGYTALHFASNEGRLGMMIQLLMQGANVNITCNEGKTPLHLVSDFMLCEFRGDQMAENLITYKADVNAKDHDGETPLYGALRRNALGLVKCLLANKADVNIVSNYQYTPLHVAVKWARFNTIKELLMQNPNLFVKDNGGETPLHIAKTRKDYFITRLLVQHCIPLIPLNFRKGKNFIDFSSEEDMRKEEWPYEETENSDEDESSKDDKSQLNRLQLEIHAMDTLNVILLSLEAADGDEHICLVNRAYQEVNGKIFSQIKQFVTNHPHFTLLIDQVEKEDSGEIFVYINKIIQANNLKDLLDAVSAETLKVQINLQIGLRKQTKLVQNSLFAPERNERIEISLKADLIDYLRVNFDVQLDEGRHLKFN